jgi:UDP-glucuronate 4-epimerase
MLQKNILVTGIAGFIGMHVALGFKRRGDFVIGIDNFDCYYDVKLKKARAYQLRKYGIECLVEDIRDSAKLRNLILEHQITHVVHLAAQVGVRYSLECPDAYTETNLDGFVKLLEVCRHFPMVPLIYASSSSVYGSTKGGASAENDCTDFPVSLYGATKKANEVIAHAYHHLYGMLVTGLRFFTVYGPWGRPDMALWIFVEKILAGEEIPIYNGGNMKRDFTFIDDIVSGVMAATDKGFSCEIINLGNHQPVQLRYLIQCIEAACEKKGVENFLPMQRGDVVETCANIKKAEELLDFAPKVSIEEGVQRFVAWYKEYTSQE